MDYFEEKDLKIKMRIERVSLALPPFCSNFIFRSLESKSYHTVEGYAYDLRQFFEFLSLQSILIASMSGMNQISSKHVSDFLSSLTERKLGASKVTRTISSLKALYRYLFKIGYTGPDALRDVERPTVIEPPIERLNAEEVKQAFQKLDLSKKRHAVRDKTIATFFLTTGVRISELVGLNLSDIDLRDASFVARRKGGRKVRLFMNDELVDQLIIYLKTRDIKSDSEPLFCGRRGRLGVQGVCSIVSHYCNITPHGLRRTFGTNLYRRTRDIYVVAEALDHASVETTRKHYAAIGEDIKRAAINGFSLMDN